MYSNYYLNQQNMLYHNCHILFRHGKTVARKPWLFILVSLSLCGLASVGLLQYKTESNPYKLWIPPDSDFVRNTDWLWSNFPPDSRYINRKKTKKLKINGWLSFQVPLGDHHSR